MIPATPSAEVAVERDDVPARTGGSPTPGPQNAAVSEVEQHDPHDPQNADCAWCEMERRDHEWWKRLDGMRARKAATS